MAGSFKAVSAVWTIVPLTATAFENVVFVRPSSEKVELGCIYKDKIKLYMY